MIALLLAAAFAPPIRIAEQIEVKGTDGSVSTHFRVRSGSSTMDFDLPGHVKSSPYDDDGKTALSPNENILALTLVTGGASRIYLLRSTSKGLRLDREFGSRLSTLLYPRVAQRKFELSQAHDAQDRRFLASWLASDAEWKLRVDSDLAPHLWAEQFGGFLGKGFQRMDKGVRANDLLIASQPAEVNHAFMFVRVSRDGRLKLIKFWHEGE